MINNQIAPQNSEEEFEKEIHLRDYLVVVQKRKTIVLAFIILAALITVLQVSSAVPVYTAATEVLIERNQAARSLQNQFSYYDPTFLATQTEIIKSANVAKRVVEKLQLDTKYRHYYFKNSQKTTSLFGTVKEKVKSLVPSFLFGGGISEPQPTAQNPVVKDVANGVEENTPTSEVDILAGIIRGGLSIKPVAETKIVRITYNDKNPLMAKLVANAVVAAYMEEILEIKLSTTNYSLQWMTSKANEERAKLEEAEVTLQKYMRANDLVTVENKLAIYPQRLSEFSSQLSQAQAARQELEALYGQIQKAGNLSSALEGISVIADNPVLKDLRVRIYKAQQNIKELSKKYGQKHPVMIKAKDELFILNREKKAELQRVVDSIKNSYSLALQKERNIARLLATTKTELLNLNEKFIQYSIMKREVDTNRVLYDALTSSIKKESVTEQSQSVNVWIVKNATTPGAPSHPNKKRSLAIGLLFGLCGGIGLAFFVEYLDNTVKNEKQLETKFGLNVLGTVEEVNGSAEKIESYILQNPLSPVAESYRLIRSGLLLSSADHPPRVILVTSMNAQEGKTSTTCNLARVLAQSKKKVLVIDCDLRRPRMHSLFTMPNETGLSNYLTGNASDNLMQRVPGEDLTLIPSGPIPPNPAELLNSKRMKMLVSKMTEVYDFVFLDSPPIQSVTDSLALSQMADGTIVVVRAGKTTYDMLESGLKKLRDTKTHLLGFVLNGLKKRDAGGGYYYGYTSYYAKDED